MYLFSVKIKNFRGYGENIDREDRCFIFDDLNVPLVVFKGYNGFGKTSFYEAIEWCLTDKVYRLEKLYDNRTYQAHELRRSHYLKFYHPTQGSSSSREIYVELTFSNGFRVVRKTLSNVLRTTEKDNSYQSTLLMGYEDLKTATNKEVLHEFIYNSRDSEAFFRTHMLGQENINDFLRHNSPSQRREIFMQLLQESKLNELLTKIKGHNIHTSKLKRSLREYNQKKEQNEKYQEQISRFIKNFDFSNIGLYLESIQNYFLHIKLIMKKNPISDVLNFESLNNIEEINLKTINLLFEKLIFKEKEISNINEGFITKKEELIRNQKEISKLFLLEKTKKNLINSKNASRLLEANLKDLQKKLDEHTTNISALKTKESNADAELNTLISYKNLFISLTQDINITELFIDDQTWDNIKNEKVKYTTFFSHYHSLIRKLIHSSEINVDVEEYNSNRNFYEELLQKRKALIDKLIGIQNLKNEISTLNKQYQLALTSMKQFVSSNPEKISECPVCLNDDFSNPKYSNKGFKNWDDSLSTANKILTIIDSTFASGDKKVDNFSKQESDVQESLGSATTEIKDVLQKVFDSLRITRTLFENQYAELEKHLRDNFQNVRNDLEQENEKQSLISEQIEKIKGSITLLFGDNYEIDQIREINLKDIIKENNDWLIENKDELNFLNGNINLTFIDTEISLLKGKQTEIYNKINLPEDIQEITKNIEYLSDLSQKINQLIKYKVPVEYESSLANYDKLGSEINQLYSQEKIIKQYIDKIELFHTELSNRQKQVIEERLENHPIVSWVYETINPHPFYKNLHIKNTDRGTNFLGEIQLDGDTDLYLDQMFSAAQLNILALSIFLGLGLTQKYSNLQQMFLDDPIQSLDDVNILAFIDVLRAIMDSNYNDKHIIISTHNEDFAQLLAIKMRNRKVTQFSIEGYTEEGPKIKKM